MVLSFLGVIWLTTTWRLSLGARRGVSNVLQQTVPYDREAFVFDPLGRVLQLEYAEEATRLGGLVLAVVVKEVCVVCAVGTVPKIFEVDDGTFCGYAGLRADGVALIDKMRIRAARERIVCPEERASPRRLAQSIGDVAHEAARGGGSRCYGARLIVAGIGPDSGEPELWTVGPSGMVEREPEGRVLRLGGKRSSNNNDQHFEPPSSQKEEDWSPEDAVSALANAAFADSDSLDALQVVVFRKEPGSAPRAPRLLAWRADLRRNDDLLLGGQNKDRWRLHPDAATSLAAALAHENDDLTS